MATPAAISSAILLLLFSLTAGDRSATFTVMNFCPFVVYPAAIPVGWGAEMGIGLGIGQAWNLRVPAGASSVRIWARTNCTFDPATGRGSCGTGDCDGSLRCDDYGKPPVTEAEFTLGSSGSAPDSYNYSISLVHGFNVPMGILCRALGDGGFLTCYDPDCCVASHRAGDGKRHTCPFNDHRGDDSNIDYEVAFYPFPSYPETKCVHA